MMPAGPNYLNVPNYFFFFGIACFAVAVGIGASLELTFTQFLLFLAIMAIVALLFLCQKRKGGSSRTLTTSYLS